MEYTESAGRCQGENGDLQGRTEYNTLDCKDRCSIDPTCTAYDLPVLDGVSHCATITSKGATGDGVTFPIQMATCYMKQTGIY